MTRNSTLTRQMFIPILMLTSTVWADYEAGQRAWDAGQRSEAIAEWQRNAQAGDAKAMLALGRSYAQGMGVLQDYVQAYKWFNLAASRGEEAAVAAREALTARMSLQEQAEARKLALEWSGSPAAVSAVGQEDEQSEAIREVQSLLATLGYQPGPADGVWGWRTTQALQAFLRDSDLPSPDSLTESLRILRSASQQTEPAQTEPLLLKPFRVKLPSREPQPFTVIAQPQGARVRIVNIEESYTAGMALALGEYEVEVSAPGYETKRETVQHGTGATERRIALVKIEPQPFTVITKPTGAQVRLLNTEEEYRPSMTLPVGRYEVEISAPGYETKRETIQHGTVATEQRVALVKAEPRRQVGQRFRDCPVCPEVVVVSSGSFLMGAPASEEGYDDTESPQHEVMVSQPLAVGVHEVTFAEWDACVSNGGCNQYRPDDAGWSRGRRPVINVSWGDAQEYVRWLAKETGMAYRLPSEAEWEYVARAGTQTPFHFGQTITPLQANYDTTYIYGGGWKEVDQRRTIPVGNFPPNTFGLYDVHGNAWEWVQDCWNRDHTEAPRDGRARTTGDCSRRVLRGGSWIFSPRILRSASRRGYAADYRYAYVGFRVVRTLPYLIPPGTDENGTRLEKATSPGGTPADRMATDTGD